VVTLGAAVGLSRLVVDTNPIDFLFADHEVRQDYEEIERRFDGYTPLEFVVRGDGNILRPEIVAAIGEWQRDAEALASVGWTTSAIDFLDQRDLTLPISTTDQPNAASTIDPAGALRVTFFVHIQSARQIAGIIDDILAAANLPPGVDATASGYLPLYVRMVDYLVSSQINSFAFALITIFVTLAIFFRSWRMALLSLPSNLLPILLTLGIMGWLGIRLDVATVTIAAIVLGIVVDDTVLFLYSLRHEQGQRASQEEAVQTAVEGSGQSILITSLVLGLGFLVYGLAEIKSVVWFGLLVSLAMGAAVIADLMVLPALIARFTREPARDDAGKAAIALRPENAR
jgi:predicted RND superfamily exporter protein